MEQDGFQNISNMEFLFLPIDLVNMDYDSFQSGLETNSLWCFTDDRDKNRYIYRYITDKMNPDQKDECLYLHYCLSDQAAHERGWGEDGTIYQVEQEAGENSLEETFCFRIQTVHLYTFRTEVSILAIQISFLKNDPGYIANGLYYLKKVQRARLIPEGAEDGDTEQKKTILETVKELFGGSLIRNLRFFPHVNEGMERANMMVMACEPEKGDWKRDLYFLRNGFRSKGFSYSEELDDPEEILMTTEDYTWGVTGENLTCIVRKETEHVLNRFILRFQEEYLFTYIILLHRKFELYKILTDLGVGEMNDLSTLNAYQDQLNSYQTDYAYERITEVPQYHRLYKKIEERMELAELFSDVMEPVSKLSSLRAEKAEKDRDEQDKRMESALGTLSILAVFSALIDCIDYLEMVPKIVNVVIPWTPTENVVTGLQFCFSVGIITLAVRVVYRMQKEKTKKKK